MVDDRQKNTNNLGKATPELVAELLVDLDIEPGAEPEPPPPDDLVELGIRVPAYLARVPEWRAKDAERKARPKPRRRKHSNILPQQPGESPDEYRLRAKRERMRIYRGVTAEGIEARTATRLAATPEDRRQKKNDGEAERRAKKSTTEQSAERQERRKRAKEREAAEEAQKIAKRAIF